MKARRYFTILLIISIILTTANCADKKGQSWSSKLAKLSKLSIGRLLNTKNGNYFNNWDSSSFARNFFKVVGYAPTIKENDTEKLEKMLLNEADLIKISAFNTINKLSKNSTANKKKFILLKLEGTIELIKYYGVVYNYPMVKITFAQGLNYVYQCRKLYEKNLGECLLKKIRLIESFIFSSKIEENRLMMYWFNKTKKEAEKYIKDDQKQILKFVDVRIACEAKLTQGNNNKLLNAGLKTLINMGRVTDCINELKKYENAIETVGSFPAEYRYLLARAYFHVRKEQEAIKQLLLARKEVVKDSKTRYVNKKVQQYFEKQFTRLPDTKKMDLIRDL
ncbi:hypothetical protein AGLY_008401 [Aphis glycines]|uniref:BDBT FKBP like N-terminal domain-containing protein n=1 Tax=Aphis glycines TaxID=307491 RepID=A0A6G0TK28_APHGL|nr:hypothetical protein AGLY_008401 [Aphis glycines]